MYNYKAEDVTVMSSMDNTPKKDIGPSVADVIDAIHSSLANLSENIGGLYNSTAFYRIPDADGSPASAGGSAMNSNYPDSVNTLIAINERVRELNDGIRHILDTLR